MNIYPLLALALRSFQVGWDAGMVVVSVGGRAPQLVSYRVLLKVVSVDDREGFSLPLGPDARMSDNGL